VILLREERDGICTLTMNRPAQMNLLTSEMLAALQGAFDQIRDDRSVRVVILAAAGKGNLSGVADSLTVGQPARGGRVVRPPERNTLHNIFKPDD